MASTTAMAPALMKGLRGLPLSCSNCTMELKVSPEGSRPILDHTASQSFLSAVARVNTLAILCIENKVCTASAKHLAVGQGDGDGKLLRVDAGQLRYIAGDLAAITAAIYIGVDVVGYCLHGVLGSLGYLGQYISPKVTTQCCQDFLF
jgi:hypothetical protein